MRINSQRGIQMPEEQASWFLVTSETTKREISQPCKLSIILIGKQLG